MPRYHARTLDAKSVNMSDLMARHPLKLAFFLKAGYRPHFWQQLFHWMPSELDPQLLMRFRAVAAGRRGGKSLSGAWDTLYYCLHPEQWGIDFHGEPLRDPFWAWMVTRDHVQSRPTYYVWKKVLREAGLIPDKDYVENKTLKYFEFKDALLEWKSALDPDKMRGPGLHHTWWDEGSTVDGPDSWDILRPGLADQQGSGAITETPQGHDWTYDYFFSPDVDDPDIGSLQYWTLDNPHFPTREWQGAKKRMHPALFMQEHCADFDAMMGKELQGAWLHYWDELPDDLDKYVGVDPAISQKDGADRFAIACIGVSRSTGTAYLIDQWAGHLPFPEQVDILQEWYGRYRPQMLGVESQAYQAALIQQANSLKTMPPITALFQSGKKADRIIGMSPQFRMSRILINKAHKDFITEWISYDSSKSRPKDDCLDSVQIALTLAGALLPDPPAPQAPTPDNSVDAWAKRNLERRLHNTGQFKQPHDEVLGSQW
jgi:phage terminase large subunit-like protein